MQPADGTCRHCHGHLGYIQSRVTMKRTLFTACPHCDTPCTQKPCKRCARMTGTVRIKDNPLEP